MHKVFPKIKVSIVTVVFNGKATLEETIHSVHSQSYPYIEYIIIDGKSTDGTIDIIKKYYKKGVISKYISEKDEGLYDAMNKGVKLSSGDLVYFLNADDILKDNKIIEKIAHVYDEKYDFIYGDIELFYSEEKNLIRITRNASIKDLKQGNMPPHQGSFVKRHILLENPFNLGYRSSADFDFFCRIIKKGAIGKKINFVVAVMRMGGVSSGKISYYETEQVVLCHFGIIVYSVLLIKHTTFSLIKNILSVFNLLWVYHKFFSR